MPLKTLPAALPTQQPDGIHCLRIAPAATTLLSAPRRYYLTTQTQIRPLALERFCSTLTAFQKQRWASVRFRTTPTPPITQPLVIKRSLATPVALTAAI